MMQQPLFAYERLAARALISCAQPQEAANANAVRYHPARNSAASTPISNSIQGKCALFVLAGYVESPPLESVAAFSAKSVQTKPITGNAMKSMRSPIAR